MWLVILVLGRFKQHDSSILGGKAVGRQREGYTRPALYNNLPLREATSLHEWTASTT